MDALSRVPVSQNYTASVVAAGTTTTLSQTNAATFSIQGKIYVQSAAWSNQATPTTDYATGNAFLQVLANNGSVYTIGVNHSGTMKVIQGTIVPLDTSGNFINAPQFGPLGQQGAHTNSTTPDDFCPLAYLLIKAGSTASSTSGWIFGTSNNSSVTGITYIFQDISTLPDRPQIS